jgi:hypothetical protein
MQGSGNLSHKRSAVCQISMAEPVAFPVALWVRCLLDRVQPADLPPLRPRVLAGGALSRAGTVACRTWASQVQPTFSAGGAFYCVKYGLFFAGGFGAIVYATSTSPTGAPVLFGAVAFQKAIVWPLFVVIHAPVRAKSTSAGISGGLTRIRSEVEESR